MELDIKRKLIDQRLIPLDKSWHIRLGVLDLINDYEDTIAFLDENYEELNDDLKALYWASLDWKAKRPVNVSES